MINKPLVSVIVPIYNVEKYLAKCIDSILNQTLENIEVILVNDGSTDNCGKIIDEYAKQDKRVISIHKENEGQSSARNIGLNIAKGKYIGFVDSDDWIESDMYESLYISIEQSKSDITVCGRQVYSQDDSLINKIEIKEEEFNFNKDLLQDYIVNRLFYKHTVVVWNKLYRKSIINDNNIRFEDVSYVGSEDALFNYYVLCHAKKINTINKIYYNQLSRDGSTARTYKYGYMNRTANMINCMSEYSFKTNNQELAKDILPIFLLFFYQWNVSQIKLFSEKDTFNLIKSEIKNVANNIEFMKYVKELGFNKNTSNHMYNMGFRLNGIILIKLVMVLYYLKNYNIATKLILLK